MDMDDMDMDNDIIESGSAASSSDDHQDIQTPIESLEPIPHVMKHPHGLPILETSLLPEERLFWEAYNTTTYYNAPSKHRAALYAHIIFALLTMVVIYPISLLFNNLKFNTWYLISLTAHTGCILVSLLNYSIFINSIESLYPGNAYNSMSWILLFSTVIQYVAALINFGYKYLNNEWNSVTSSQTSGASTPDHFFPFEDYDDDNHSDYSSPAITLYDLSRQGTTTNSFELNSDDHSNGQNMTSTNSMLLPDNHHLDHSPSTIRSKTIVSKVFTLSIFQHISSSIYKVANVTFNLLNWGHFFYFLVYIPTGVATFALYGKGQTVFNLLAHFIKGGVFFSYGVLSLARYSGAFQSKGWAWNHKFINESSVVSSYWNKIQGRGLCTMEMIESGLILFYGSTNIFLEHLSDAGQEWSPKDLQHVSIAFIYIGAGLCGVITEFKLATWRYEKSIENLQNFERYTSIDNQIQSNVSKPGKKSKSILSKVSSRIMKASPGFSPNPFPVVTIYWTGILMSSHQQASSLSTEIHVQWGQLFLMGCIFRFLTYILVLLTPPSTKSLTKPSRPITELVVSFSLLCGGLVFMESTDPVVLSFEYYGFTSMFTLNLSLGFIMLFMSWEMSLFAFKDWLIGKYFHPRRQALTQNHV
ncbi:uncharacterized protein RJT21DRAFT_4896 [Scheffersomyces amazonensis]|uniref:uncharacterized protein n=1 Tax=Scheffersomyces amazonensis TaxID=1078765 RepID=UPI00315D4A16